MVQSVFFVVLVELKLKPRQYGGRLINIKFRESVLLIKWIEWGLISLKYLMILKIN